MSNTKKKIKLTGPQLGDLLKRLFPEAFKEHTVTDKNVAASFKINDLVIHLYRTGTLLFQGQRNQDIEDRILDACEEYPSYRSPNLQSSPSTPLSPPPPSPSLQSSPSPPGPSCVTPASQSPMSSFQPEPLDRMDLVEDGPLPRRSHGPNRKAFIAGIERYQRQEHLQGVSHDIQAVSDLCEHYGFNVVRAVDYTLTGFDTAVENFLASLKDSDTSLFYFSGHGYQSEGNSLLLVKEDGKKPNEYNLNKYVEALKKKKGTHILILDCCRDKATKRSSVKQTTINATAYSNMFIMFATAEGDTAYDGDEGKCSVFTGHLVNIFKSNPNLEIEALSKMVRNAVVTESKGKQFPWDSSGLMCSFKFQ